MSRHVHLEEGESELLLEGLAYMGRRFFDPGDQSAILEIEEAIERVRRQAPRRGRRSFALPDPQADLLVRVLAAYGRELKHPSSAADNRERSEQIRRIGLRVQRAGSLLGRLRGLLGSP
jgi:hypothetical protein